MNRKFFYTVFMMMVMFGTLAFRSFAADGINPAKKAEIEKVLTIINMPLDMQFGFLPKDGAGTGIPADVWKEVVSANNINETEDILDGIYDKHFTLDELKAVNQFYGSAAGKKWHAAMPKVMGEFFTEKRKLDEKQLIRIIDDLRKKGYKVDQLENSLKVMQSFQGLVPGVAPPEVLNLPNPGK